MDTYYKTLFFDFDGTIHDSIHIYYPAFLKGYAALVEKGQAKPRTFTKREVSHWLGYSSTEMWRSFMPDCPEIYQNEARVIIGSEMKRLLEQGKGVLYDGAYEVLATLREKGYTLVFLSNCGEDYMNTAIKVFGLDRYFHRFVCSAQFNQAPKWEILRSLLPEFEPAMAIIGDRFHDMEAGFMNDITTVACLYGYGDSEEFHQADKVITSLSKLTAIF